MAVQSLSVLEYSLRGNILATTVEIERKIDDYLSSYFCSDLKKKNELCEMLFYTERMTLDLKIQMLDTILDNKAPNGLITNLRAIVTARNIFAHLEIDESKNTSYSITFKKYSKGKFKPKTYNTADLNLLAEQVKSINYNMDMLIKAMPPLS